MTCNSAPGNSNNRRAIASTCLIKLIEGPRQTLYNFRPAPLPACASPLNQGADHLMAAYSLTSQAR